MAGFESAPLPTADALVDKRGHATQPLIDWSIAIAQDVDAAAARLTDVTLVNQSASLGATPFSVGVLSSGLYRVSYFARITTPATSSSSLEVAFNFTHGGVACTMTGDAMTGNTPSTVGSGTFLISVDAQTPVSYLTTYASSGGTPMAYTLTVTIDQVSA